jgi:F-type H+-transporting ATPase subunit gamma
MSRKRIFFVSRFQEIRHKIQSIKSTAKITSAMQMVAAAKMKKAQDLTLKARPYTQHIRQIVEHLLSSYPDYKHPLFEIRKPQHVAYIVISTKRGLCGGLNHLLFKNVLDHARAQKQKGVAVSSLLIGAKAIEFFRGSELSPLAIVDPQSDTPTLEDLVGVLAVALKSFEKQNIDEIYLCYNLFKGSMHQIPQVETLLPLTLTTPEENKSWEYLFDENPMTILDILLTRYIEALLYQSILENYTSEQAARMLAMQAASDNANNLISELKLMYNKARQAQITTEITEIVSGAAAITS